MILVLLDCGFCFEKNLIALVYEYVSNGFLDSYLFHEKKTLGYGMLHEIAVRSARGIAYWHEECLHCIIHFDYNPKVADFGIAKLCNILI